MSLSSTRVTVQQHPPQALGPRFSPQRRVPAPPCPASGRRGRHPELLRIATDGSTSSSSFGITPGAPAPGSGTSTEQPRPEEVDERYRRVDFSDVFQYEARQAFARCIAGGEPRMRLAEAALHVTAEDDAIASHSTVRFPVAAWMDRIERLVDQLCSSHLRRAAAAAAGATAGGGRSVHGDAAAAAAEAEAVLRVAERYLFEEVGFRMPEYGRSNLPANSVVDHAGVWEDARLGYLHETLIRRVGHPAALALLLGEVVAQLLARGVLPCAAAIDTRSYMMLPRAVPIPTLTRELLLGPHGPAVDEQHPGGAGGSGSLTPGLNTCTSEVLVEMLRHLKRSYWPFPWDTGVDAAYPHAVGSYGGFRSAAKAAMGGDVSAALAAISKVAAWRLERGIWTSPGAGDLRRARAACERLVLLAGDRYPEERRDLAILLLHCGEVGAARLELRTYLQMVSKAGAAAPSAAADPRVHRGDLPDPDPYDLLLCRRLLEALGGGPGAEQIITGAVAAGEGEGEDQAAAAAAAGADGEAAAGATLRSVVEPEEPLGLEATLRAVPPWEQAQPAGRKRYLPLTW